MSCALRRPRVTAKLNQTAPHYIRCIKPNNANRPMLFENANVLHQLRCGGVLEAGLDVHTRNVRSFVYRVIHPTLV